MDATTRLSHCNVVSERSVSTTSLLCPFCHNATRLDIDNDVSERSMFTTLLLCPSCNAIRLDIDNDVSERSVFTTSLLCPSCHNATPPDIDAAIQLSHFNDMSSCHIPQGLHIHPDFLSSDRVSNGHVPVLAEIQDLVGERDAGPHHFELELCLPDRPPDLVSNSIVQLPCFF